METKNRIWWGTAVLSLSALMLTACDGDDGGDDAPADEAPAEETEENGTTEETPEDEGDDEAPEDPDEDAEPDEEDSEAADTALDEDDMRELLLTQDELPVEVEQFESDESLADGEAMTVPDSDVVETCDELAEVMQDPQSAEDYAGSGEEVDVAGLFSMGMWNLEAQDPADMGMLQFGIMSSEDDLADYEDDYDLIRECEGETFTMEEEGAELEMSFEYIEYGEWEGMTMFMTTHMGEESVDFDMQILTYEDGPNALFVSAMGEGEEHLEELADLQLEKYEAGV